MFMYFLKQVRLKWGYTCQEMASKLKISKPFYWQIENGKRRMTYHLAIQISQIFDMTPDQLFYDDYIRRMKE